MTDLITLLGSLVDVRGKILIDGVNDSVLPLTEEEAKLYGPIDFDPVSSALYTWRGVGAVVRSLPSQS